MNEERTKEQQVIQIIPEAQPRSMTSIPEPVIYQGTMMENLGDQKPGFQNRKAAKRKISPFTLMLILLGAAILIVLYISNVIRVTQLLAEVNRMENQHQRILMDQEILRAQVNRMSSLERVRKIGEEQLGLKNPQSPPVWINVDQEKIRAIEEATKKNAKR